MEKVCEFLLDKCYLKMNQIYGYVLSIKNTRKHSVYAIYQE